MPASWLLPAGVVESKANRSTCDAHAGRSLVLEPFVDTSTMPFVMKCTYDNVPDQAMLADASGDVANAMTAVTAVVISFEYTLLFIRDLIPAASE
jgi:hypothetical protein